jgi:hypothetical protein
VLLDNLLRRRVAIADGTFAPGSVFKVNRGYLSMFTTKRTIPRVLGMLLAACLLVAAQTTSFALSAYFRPPPLYLIEGYLDRAPKEADVLDRIDITAQGRRHTLLITRYATPGETGLDRYLSRVVMAQSFAIQGATEEVDRLAGAPPGTKIAGTFAAYTGGSPWLLIVDLTAPPPKP